MNAFSSPRISRTTFRAVTGTVVVAAALRFLTSHITGGFAFGRLTNMENPPINGLHGLNGLNGLSVQHLDLLTASAQDLQHMLDEGSITSRQLVELYLKQIEKHNHFGMRLNAIISTAPRDDVFERASALDEERKTKGKRSAMHGIPIIVKDNMCTPSLGMDTTCGSYALSGATSSRDATIITRLLEAGMLIIGKANLTEWSQFKEALITGGWSAVGGQTQSPYVRGGVLPNATFLGHSTPCGSSSGSAVGVAAGFAPVSLGTESDGSLVQPATRAGLYGLKATVGAVPTDGCQANSPMVATSGAMAKTVKDLADVLSILMKVDFHSTDLNGSWDGINLGFVNPDLWQPASFVVEPNESFKKQTYNAIQNAYKRIGSRGGTIVKNVPLITLAETTKDSCVNEIEDLMRHETREGIKKFLSLFTGTSVKTLEDLIEFNKEHATIELPVEHPGQQAIENAAKDNMTKSTFELGLQQVRSTAVAEIKKSLQNYKVDVIIGPADARMASVAAAAGFPVATVPLGYADFNGRAFGMNIIAAAGAEHTMLRVMSAWEATFPEARKPPPMMVHWDEMIMKGTAKI